MTAPTFNGTATPLPFAPDVRLVIREDATGTTVTVQRQLPEVVETVKYINLGRSAGGSRFGGALENATISKPVRAAEWVDVAPPVPVTGHDLAMLCLLCAFVGWNNVKAEDGEPWVLVPLGPSMRLVGRHMGRYRAWTLEQPVDGMWVAFAGHADAAATAASWVPVLRLHAARLGADDLLQALD
jgi:hypothetical protein